MEVNTHLWSAKLFIFLALFSGSWKDTVSQLYSGDRCSISANGPRGICRSIYQCPYARRQYDNYGIRPTNCGFSGTTPIVCCVEDNAQQGDPGQQTPAFNRPSGNANRPSSNVNRPSSNDNRPISVNSRPQGGRSISEIKCDEYSTEVTDTVEALPLLPDAEPLSFKTEKCEYTSTELIVGGQDAKIGEFPHMAAIGWESQFGSDYEWLCGGALISNNYVLTAAHCTYVNSDRVSNTEPIVVRLGEHNIKSTYDGANPVDIRIASKILHPEYRPPQKYNDIALFRLEQAAQLSKFIRPACLWNKQNFEDRQATAIGWGNTEDKGKSADILQTVTLDLIDQNTCSRLNPVNNRKLRQGVINSQMCAGNVTGGSDTCQGDSGGPLQVSSKQNRCIFYLIGVTSFGNGCARANTAGVYTRISNYVTWIENIVWPNN